MDFFSLLFCVAVWRRRDSRGAATVELEKTSKSINNMCCEFVEETRYDEDKVQRRLHEAVAAFDNAE